MAFVVSTLRSHKLINLYSEENYIYHYARPCHGLRLALAQAAAQNAAFGAMTCAIQTVHTVPWLPGRAPGPASGRQLSEPS
jgi:hypothetical protein